MSTMLMLRRYASQCATARRFTFLWNERRKDVDRNALEGHWRWACPSGSIPVLWQRGKKRSSATKRGNQPNTASFGDEEVASVVDSVVDPMRMALESLERSLQALRGGRLPPDALDGVRVEGPGHVRVMLRQVAQVSLRDARTLVVSVHDSTWLSACEKAIRGAGLGLQPVVTGGKHESRLDVPIPVPSREAREGMAKTAASLAEEARKRMRTARRDAMEQLRKIPSEDLRYARMKQVERITEDWVKQVDAALEKKRQELGVSQ